MIDAIEAAIAAIEYEHDVRVLYAAESGSRAWGFASPDSDYDVRFIYARRRDWYLGIGEPRDVIEAMRKDSGLALESIRVDGGATRNGALLQFQADILGARVLRPAVAETTALGAAYLAGLATGVWSDQEDIQRLWALDRTFTPAMDDAKRESLYAGWTDAVSRTRSR